MSKLYLLGKLAGLAFLLVGGCGLVILACHFTVEHAARNRLHLTPQSVPKRKAALVLGCAKTLSNGWSNSFFGYRIDAAAQLYHAGKCDYLIVSGDNSRKNYDEPTDMQNALIKKGVPESRIYRDFAGFRTLDSVVRAKEIFGQSEIIVVSQAFHNTRAIYLARKHGIDAVGMNGQDVNTVAGVKTEVREYFARVKTVLDVYLLRTSPKFLGPKVKLGGPRPQHS